MQIDAVVAISENDAETLRAAYAIEKATTIQPTIRTISRGLSDRPRNLIYIGTKAEHNRIGLIWFFANVWPRLITHMPNLRLHVVGDISDVVGEVPEGVVLHGRVREFEGLAKQCRVAINPLTLGTGIKIKMLDYMALQLPAVVSPAAAEGFPTTPKPPFLVASDQADFEKHLISLLSDTDLYRELVDRIDPYIVQFGQRNAMRSLSMLFDEISGQ